MLAEKHTTAPVARSITAMRSDYPDSSGRGCIILDEPVFFDVARRPAIGDLALVILHDGRFGVFPVRQSCTEPKPGCVYVEDKPPPKWAVSALSHVTLVGVVTEPNGAPLAAPPSPRLRIERRVEALLTGEA